MEETKVYKKPTLAYSVFVLLCLACSTFVGLKVVGAS